MEVQTARWGPWAVLLLAGASMLSARAERAHGFPVAVGESFRDCPDCPEMVVIPPARFLMGSPAGEKGRFANEGPQHEVVLPHAIAISKYPVTMGDLRRWQPSRSPALNDDSPAIMVTWVEASAYTAWLRKAVDHAYHLPTEAEYEYAERAGTTTRYYWGDAIGVGNANCFGCGSDWDSKGASPAGSFPPNGFGLYDMTGNVFEWVEDCYVESEEGAPSDATIARESPTTDCPMRVLRGSSSYNLPSFLRSAYRFRELPASKSARRSFRLVREPDQPAT
jgi:formylglycine-generating enzyme required for sulfatase activity